MALNNEEANVLSLVSVQLSHARQALREGKIIVAYEYIEYIQGKVMDVRSGNLGKKGQ